MVNKLIRRIVLMLLLFMLVSSPLLEAPLFFSSLFSFAEAKEFSPPNKLGKDAGRAGGYGFENLIGEKLSFKLTFLWFKNIAQAEFEFGETDVPGQYYSSLTVEANGLVKWLTHHRRHAYKSVFELADGEKRLRSSYHKRTISYRKEEKVLENYMDYSRKLHTRLTHKNGELTGRSISEIPDGKVFEDVLSAFYNFRQGVFGLAESGKKYSITTIPTKEGLTHFRAKIITPSERASLLGKGEKDFDSAYLMIIDIPPEIFDSKTGEGRIWFGKDMRPIAGMVKDVRGLGDVLGALE